MLLNEELTLSREKEGVGLEGELSIVFVHIHVDAYMLTLLIVRPVDFPSLSRRLCRIEN